MWNFILWVLGRRECKTSEEVIRVKQRQKEIEYRASKLESRYGKTG